MPLILLASLFGPMPTALASPVPTGSARHLSSAGQDGESAQVAVDPAGNAVVVWVRYDGANWRVQARRRTASGSLSAVQTLSAAGQDAIDPQVALDAKGHAVVVWARSDGNNDRIQARRRTASGGLSAVQTLSTAGRDAFLPQVAVGGDGNAVVVWIRYDGTDNRIQVRRRTAGGGLSAVQNLSPAGRDATDPKLAVDRVGRAVVVWARSDGTNERIQARRRAAGGGLSTVQALSPAGNDAFDPQLAVDRDGKVVVVWTRSDGVNDRIQARRRTATGGLSAVQTFSPAGQDASKPQVAVDRDGNAVVVWTRSDATNERIEVRRRTAAGDLSAVQTLSLAGQDASKPQVAVDRDGNAVVVWQVFDGANFRIQSLGRTASGSLSEIQTLSAAGQNAGGAELGVDPEGNAVAAWSRFDGANNRVQAVYLLEVKSLSPAGWDAVNSQVAVDAKGNALLVWQRLDGGNWRIQARRRSASGSLGAVQTLSAAGQNAEDPQLAFDAHGNAVVVWRRYDGANDRIQVRRRAASGTWNGVQTLSAAGQDAAEPQVAVDPDGNALVAWRRFDGTNTRIQARRRSAAGGLGAVQTLSAAGQNAYGPQVAVDPNGKALVVWDRYDGAHTRIQVRRRSASGTWSAGQTLSAAGQNANAPQLAVDANGNALAVWQRFDGAGVLRIQVRRRTAAGSLSAVQTLSAAGQSAFSPQVDVSGGGHAVVVWERYDGTENRIQVRRRTAAGSLSAVQTISAAGQPAFSPQVAVDGDGKALVAWYCFDGVNDRVQARRRSASGSLSVVQTLSPEGQDAHTQQVGVDANGNAVVVWQRFDSADWRIQVARLRTG